VEAYLMTGREIHLLGRDDGSWRGFRSHDFPRTRVQDFPRSIPFGQRLCGPKDHEDSWYSRGPILLYTFIPWSRCTEFLVTNKSFLMSSEFRWRGIVLVLEWYSIFFALLLFLHKWEFYKQNKVRSSVQLWLLQFYWGIHSSIPKTCRYLTLAG
jgi:hypothetical protein